MGMGYRCVYCMQPCVNGLGSVARVVAIWESHAQYCDPSWVLCWRLPKYCPSQATL